MATLGNLVCGEAGGEGRAKEVLGHLGANINHFSEKALVFLNEPFNDDARSFGAFCSRVILENACAGLVGRLDSFRLLYLREFQNQATYEYGRAAKSGFKWTGDVIPADRPNGDMWHADHDLLKISRALFSQYSEHLHWIPAFNAAVDYIASTEVPPGVFEELMSIEAEQFIGRMKGHCGPLYSTLSKGVHWEFFLSSAIMDEDTVKASIRDCLSIVSNLAFVSHFIPTAYNSLAPNEALSAYIAFRGGTDLNELVQESDDDGLILAAEECPPEKFDTLHFFSTHDDVIIRKLSAHGPVLVRGGRGSGKSALLIEAHRRMRKAGTVFSVYMSLRYLPLLQSDGAEYISHFCGLLSKAIGEELIKQNYSIGFAKVDDQVALQQSLNFLSENLNKRIVILFDDAAHIGREKPLEVFFDLFRTISSNVTSCKASIYPGVTRFGLRFDVFNDSTVIDVSRSDVSAAGTYFLDVLKSRYPALALREIYSDRLHPEQFANLIGRAVVGNMRGFILACNRFENKKKIGVPEATECLLVD